MGDCTTAVERIGREYGMQSIVDGIHQNQRNGIFDHISKNRNRLETEFDSKKSYEIHYIRVFLIQKVKQQRQQFLTTHFAQRGDPDGDEAEDVKNIRGIGIICQLWNYTRKADLPMSLETISWMSSRFPSSMSVSKRFKQLSISCSPRCGPLEDESQNIL